jgi:hypothetical protein
MTIDFAGLNGFVWWTGVVEDRQDPLKLGRYRVRIIGWHDADVNMIPTDALPWAQILQSPTGPRTFGSIKEGEWVTGYFLDGQNGQEPVIMGVYPGIITQDVRTVNSPIPQLGFSDRRTPAQIANSPRLPEGVVADVKGEPSLPPTARGKVEDTGLNVSNQNLTHVCDFTNELQRDLALVRLEFSALMNKIRQAIRAFIASLGLDPSGEISRLVSLAKSLLRELKYIQDIIQEIVDIKNVLIEYARKVRAMIDYILSLPAKLLALLQDCLQNFLGSIASVISGLLQVPGLEGLEASPDIGELMATLEEAGNVTRKIIQDSIDIVTLPAQLTVAILTPSSSEEMNQAGNTISNFLTNNTSNESTLIVSSTFSSANTKLP